MIITGVSGKQVLSLRKCPSVKCLTPVFEIDNHGCTSFVYRYDGDLWVKSERTLADLRGLAYRGYFDKEENKKNAEESLLVVGSDVYAQTVEPFYYLDLFHSGSVNHMICVAYHKEDELLVLNRRRFSYKEREDAVSCAQAILKLAFAEKEEYQFPPAIIKVLPAFYESEGVPVWRCAARCCACRPAFYESEGVSV